MDESWILTIIIIFLLMLWLAYDTFQRPPYEGPPHITGLPIVGYLPFLGKETHVTLHNLAYKYGPVFSIYLGSVRTIVLGNYKAVHEAFVLKGNNFSSRPEDLIFKIYDHERAFVYLDGEKWKETRNFAMNSLRNLGFGKKSLQPIIQLEINCFLKEVEKNEGRVFDPRFLLTQSIGNAIFCLFTGDRRDYSDPWHMELTATAKALVNSVSNDFRGMFPWMKKNPITKYILDHIKFSKTVRDLKDRMWHLWEQEMEAKRQEKLPSFITDWFAEQEKRQSENHPDVESFSDFRLKNNLDMMTQAALDTTAVTIQWAFLYLILHPDIQKRVQDEIDDVIGSEREPLIDDSQQMNYTRAFIKELHRFSSIVPLAIPHSAKEDETVMNFKIPKGSMVIANCWGVHHDPEYFPEPDRFNPNRFLDGEGNLLQCDQLIPFSIGRRICPGKAVADMKIFLYLTSILQKFKLEAPPDIKLTMEPTLGSGGVLSPKHLRLCAKMRL